MKFVFIHFQTSTHLIWIGTKRTACFQILSANSSSARPSPRACVWSMTVTWRAVIRCVRASGLRHTGIRSAGMLKPFRWSQTWTLAGASLARLASVSVLAACVFNTHCLCAFLCVLFACWRMLWMCVCKRKLETHIYVCVKCYMYVQSQTEKLQELSTTSHGFHQCMECVLDRN